MNGRTLTSSTAAAVALLVAACSPVVRTFTSSSTTTSTTATGGSATGGSTTTTTTTACSPESDADLCTMLSATCDMATGKDNCGASRTVDCGACTGSNVCDSNACKAPVCASLIFGGGTPIASAVTAEVQNMVAGITPDGSSMLIKRGTAANPCADYTVLIADAMPPNSMSYVLTQVTPPAGMDLVNEEFATISDDGLEIIAANTAHTGFLGTVRSGPGKVDFGAPVGADYVNIVATGTQVFYNPYLAPGQLAFYYQVGGDTNAANNGIYEATRPTTSVPFDAGVLMPAPVQDYAYVTARSSDGMTLFVQDSNYGMAALTRTSLSQPFVNPNAPAAAPIIPGFRTRPLTTCTTLVGTCVPPGQPYGGCRGEQICTFPGM
jgi:hypothetical protein